MSISEDYFDVGRQAGEMANQIFTGMRPGEIARAGPISGIIAVNVCESEYFSVTVDSKITPKNWKFKYFLPVHQLPPQ